jgi:hypothetical protein
VLVVAPVELSQAIVGRRLCRELVRIPHGIRHHLRQALAVNIEVERDRREYRLRCRGRREAKSGYLIQEIIAVSFVGAATFFSCLCGLRGLLLHVLFGNAPQCRR